MNAPLHALSAAVTHFLWQGAVLGVAVVAAQRLWARGSARARHDLALAGLLASWVAFLSTLAMELAEAGAGVDLESLHADMALLSMGELLDLPLDPAAPEPLGPWLGAAWCFGAGLMGLRLLRGLVGTRALRVQATSPPEGRLQATVDELRSLLSIRRRVRVLEHPSLSSPAVVGWWEPVILVPLALGARLSPAQVRAVLAHELAHIRRSDHLVNLLLATSEVVLFFHPLTWWLLRTLRAEREHCCDDLAAATTHEPRLLAEALTQLEDLRLAPQAALAARPKEGDLMIRIRRLLEARSLAPRRALGPVALATLALSTGMAGAYAKEGLEASVPALQAELREAQDGDLAQLERRLRAAVEAGLLSEAEVERTLGALRRLARRERAQEERPAGDELRRAAERIEAGIKAGKLTEEEGRMRLRQLREAAQESRGSARDSELQRVEPEQQRVRRERYAAAKARLEGGVKDGKLTAEQAKLRLEGLRQELFGDGEAKGSQRPKAGPEVSTAQRERRMRFAKATAEIKQAVEAGKLSREEAGAKVRQLRAEMAAEAAGERDRAGMEAEQQRALRMRYAELEQRLQEAVAAGKLSREDAQAKLADTRKEMFGDREAAKRTPAEAPSEGDLPSVGHLFRREADAKKNATPGRKGKVEEARRRFEEEARKIEAAIKAEKISEEDGKAKLEALQKQFDAPLPKSSATEKQSGKKSKSKSKAEEKPVSSKSKAPEEKEKASQKDSAPKKSKVGDSL